VKDEHEYDLKLLLMMMTGGETISSGARGQDKPERGRGKYPISNSQFPMFKWRETSAYSVFSHLEVGY
jgi:hypothetical protein